MFQFLICDWGQGSKQAVNRRGEILGCLCVTGVFCQWPGVHEIPIFY